MAKALRNWAWFSFTFKRFAANGRILHAPLILIRPTIECVTASEHIFEAMRLCENGVRWKASTQRFEINTLRWAANIRNRLQDGTYVPMKPRKFDITERGKLRHIQASHISDRTAQKSLCRNVLQPTIYPKLIYDNSASQKYKGIEFALKRLKEHLRWHLSRYGKSGVIITTDLHDYFNSIPHPDIIEQLTEDIFDSLLNKYIEQYINEHEGQNGLGLGSEINQIAAIYYPNSIDRIVKEKYSIHCAARYDEYLAGRMKKEQIEQSYETWRSYAKKYDSYKSVGAMDLFYKDIMRCVA